MRGEIFWESQCAIYHSLRIAFGQCVTIAQIVHFYVSDIVTVLLVDVFSERAAGRWLRGRFAGSSTRTRAIAL